MYIELLVHAAGIHAHNVAVNKAAHGHVFMQFTGLRLVLIPHDRNSGSRIVIIPHRITTPDVLVCLLFQIGYPCNSKLESSLAIPFVLRFYLPDDTVATLAIFC